MEGTCTAVMGWGWRWGRGWGWGRDDGDGDGRGMVMGYSVHGTEVIEAVQKNALPKRPDRQKTHRIERGDEKRQYNMCLVLTRLKMSDFLLRDAILNMDEDTLDLELIQKIRKILPTTEEQQLLKNAAKKYKYNNLERADKFVYWVIN